MSKRKGIVYIDPQSYRNLSVYDYSLLTALREYTDESITFFGSSCYDHLPLPDSIAFKPVFTYNHKKNAIVKALSYMWSYAHIIVYLMRRRPRLVHFQWFKLTPFDRRLLWLTAHLSNIRTIHTVHNLLPHDTGVRYQADYNHIYHTADCLIVHTQDTREQLVAQFHISPAKVSIIPHGLLHIDVDEQLLSRNASHYEALYQTAGHTVFAALGEQTVYKGIDLLADVWLSTPELCNNPQLRLIVVGHQDSAIDLSRLAQCGNVVMSDRRIPNDEFCFLLRHTDVYLLPYRRISQSGALLTVLSEQVPVLVSQVGGLCDPLRVADVGWSIRPNDPEALRSQLLHLAHNANEISRIKSDTNAWQRIAAYYNWQHIAQLTAKVYETGRHVSSNTCSVL